MFQASHHFTKEPLAPISSQIAETTLESIGAKDMTTLFGVFLRSFENNQAVAICPGTLIKLCQVADYGLMVPETVEHNAGSISCKQSCQPLGGLGVGLGILPLCNAKM